MTHYIGDPMFPELGMAPQLIAPDPPSQAQGKGDFISTAVDALKLLCETQPEVCADDLYAVLPQLPANPNEMGSIWRQAVEWGWVAVGREKRSKRKEAHGRKIPVYRSQLYATK